MEESHSVRFECCENALNLDYFFDYLINKKYYQNF